MGKSSRRPHDRAAHIFADIILRLCYFVGTALILLFSIRRYYYWYDEQISLWHFIVILVAALFFAVFGPSLDRIESERGRGSLDEIKRQSRRDDE